MSRVQIRFAALIMMLPAIALAGQGQRKAACREEIRRLCDPLPVPFVVQRWIAPVSLAPSGIRSISETIGTD